MPKDIQKRIEEQMRTFLWDGKKAIMNWKEASQPRETGELNMLNIEIRSNTNNVAKKVPCPKM